MKREPGLICANLIRKAMKSCDYCGRQNENDSIACPECGTPFLAPPAPEPPPLIAIEPKLTGARATLILVIFIGAQFLVALVAGAAAGITGQLGGADLRDRHNLTEFMQGITAPIVVIAALGGGIVMLAACTLLIGNELADETPTGAAWRVGSIKHVSLGLGMGFMAGLAYGALALIAGPTWMHSQGPLTRMAQIPGLSRFLWVVIGLLVAPPIEELLFRGVLYGGYRRSFGHARAALASTAIFCALHLPEVIHFLPALVGISGLALVALWCRLRSSAIGSAIAAHFGYNLVVALALLAL